MADRILFFESDSTFAGQVKSHFEQLGVQVDVVADGSQGLKWAERNPPALILLTVELDGMNGFLICKRLKKDEFLRSIPVLILSSDATDETFEQHKRLRTHAEAYLHKPVTVADLQESVRSMLQHAAGERPESGALILPGQMDFHDEEHLLVSDDDQWTALASISSPPAVEQFAEQAFDALMVEPQESLPVQLSPSLLPSSSMTIRRASSRPLPPFSSSTSSRVTGSVAATALTTTAVEEVPHLNGLQDNGARGEIEARVTAAEQARVLAEERAASAEAALAEAHRRGGVTSREFLDLREQLNRKDRELLDLRDQIAVRDKQLIEVNSRSLTLERDLTETRDQHTNSQREADKSRELARTLADDREGSKKREEDLRARLHRAEGKVRELEDALEKAEVSYEARLEAAHRGRAEAVARLEADYASRTQDREQTEETLRAELSRVTRELENIRSDRETVRAEELADLQRIQDAALQHQAETIRAELEERLEAVTEAHRRELVDQEQAHRRDVASSLEDYQARVAEAQAALATANEAHRKELSHLGRALSEADTRMQSLSERLDASEAARQSLEVSADQARQELERLRRVEGELRAHLERLATQMAHDEQLVERVRRAMAIGLGLLDQRTSEASNHSSS